MLYEDSFEVEYMYDENVDMLGIKVKRDYNYNKTAEIDERLLLDFDENNVPVASEILDASKLLNVPKDILMI